MTTENGWFQFDHGSCKPDIISPSMLGVILGKHEVPLAIHPRDEPVHKADRSWSTFGQLTAPFDDAARAKQAYGAAHWGTTVPLHSPPVSPPTRRISAELSAAAVRARPGRLSGLSVSHSKSVLYGVFVWARRALKRQKTAFSGPGRMRMKGDTIYMGADVVSELAMGEADASAAEAAALAAEDQEVELLRAKREQASLELQLQQSMAQQEKTERLLEQAMEQQR